jgi:AraC-like DNA-binding protein
MFIGFSILFFIGVNTGNLLLYTLFSKNMVSEINAGNLDMLAKVKNATELMYEEMIALSTQLGHNNITITKIMFENERDRLLEYQGHQILQNALVSFPYIDYFAIYNERLDELIGTMYFSAASEAELKSLARNYYQQGMYRLTIPLAVENRPSSGGVLNTITLVIYSPLSLENDKGVFLVGINCDYFQQLISKMDEGNLDTVMILHGNGRVISHPDISQVLTDYSGNDFFKEINSAGGASDFFIRDIDATKTIVSYTRSGVLDWIFINMAPYKKITARILFLRNLTLIITLVILCAGISTSYFLAVKMYKPIQQVLNRLNYNPPRKRNDPRSNENLYIEKQLEYLSSKAIETAFKDPYYMVCVFSYDKQEDFGKLDAAGQEDMRNRLVKIVEELFKKACTAMDYAAISSTDIALLLHLSAGAAPENLGLLMAETGEMVKRFNGLTVSAAAGPVVNSIFSINESFEEAQKILKERFFLGTETFILSEEGLPPIVRDAVKLVEEKYIDPVFSINAAADFFNITPAYFNRVFKKHKHTSYSEFLNGYRMEKARTMLLETNEPVNAIANSVGINNTTYFYTLFKKIYNCTPQQFRNTRK